LDEYRYCDLPDLLFNDLSSSSKGAIASIIASISASWIELEVFSDAPDSALAKLAKAMIAMETSFQLDHIMIGGLECSVNNIMM
jgi:hypothetical protein